MTLSATAGVAIAARSDHRLALARQVFALLRRALPAEDQLEFALGSDAPTERVAAARVVVRDPDALGRLLWPPSASALGEAYLRGDIDIEGDICAAVDAGGSFDLRRLGRDLPRLARLGIQLTHGAAPAPSLRRRARLSGRRHSRARDLAAIRFHYDVPGVTSGACMSMLGAVLTFGWWLWNRRRTKR